MTVTSYWLRHLSSIYSNIVILASNYLAIQSFLQFVKEFLAGLGYNYEGKNLNLIFFLKIRWDVQWSSPSNLRYSITENNSSLFLRTPWSVQHLKLCSGNWRISLPCQRVNTRMRRLIKASLKRKNQMLHMFSTHTFFGFLHIIVKQ